MKAVLMSIKQKWCAKIANGQKTVEIRKNRPSLKPPFKCYIYETKGKTERPRGDEDGYIYQEGRGAVIGEFVCDRMEQFYIPYPAYQSKVNHALLDAACLTYWDIHLYAGSGRTLYGWHISDLLIYEKPRSLGEFWKWCDPRHDLRPCQNRELCENAIFDFERNTEACVFDYDASTCPHLCLQRPPQTWCYVIGE